MVGLSTCVYPEIETRFRAIRRYQGGATLNLLLWSTPVAVNARGRFFECRTKRFFSYRNTRKALSFRAVMDSADGASRPCCLFLLSTATGALSRLCACSWSIKPSSIASGRMALRSALPGARLAAGAM